MKYLGDFPADQAIYFAWNTNDSDGASITRSGDGTISVYKDNSNGSSFDTTQVTTGVTNDEDFDALTGVHTCCITTTNAWYETGHDYIVVLSASTIDTQTVNSVIAHFSIENRFMRGTNSAALAATALSDATWTAAKAGYLDVATSSRNATTPPTVTAIRQEMDANSTKMAPSQTLNDYKATGFSTHNAAAIWAVGTRALTDKAGFSLSTAGIDAIWDDLIAGMTAVGSIGKLIADNLNASITSRAPSAEYDTQMGYIPSNLGDVPTNTELNNAHGSGSWATATGFSTHNAASIWSVGTRALTDKSGFALSTAGIEALWDDLTSGMIQVGSIGKLIADNLDATVSSRNATTPPTVIEIRTEMDANSTKMAPSQVLADYKATGFNTVVPDAAGVAPTAVEIRTEMDNNSTKMAPSQTLNDYKATGFNTTTPPTVGEIRTEMEGVGTKLTLTLEDTAELQGNQADWATATSVTVSDKTGFSLSTAGVDAILDENIEGTHTLREMMRLFASALVGKVSGGGTTTIVFRDIDDTKNRIVATVTDVGNRTAMALAED